MTKPIVTVVNNDPLRRSTIAIELESDAEALALAQHLAVCTQRTVIVVDTDGDVLHIAVGAAKN